MGSKSTGGMESRRSRRGVDGETDFIERGDGEEEEVAGEGQ